MANNDTKPEFAALLELAKQRDWLVDETDDKVHVVVQAVEREGFLGIHTITIERKSGGTIEMSYSIDLRMTDTDALRTATPDVFAEMVAADIRGMANLIHAEEEDDGYIDEGDE